MIKKAIQIPSERSERLRKKKPKQNSSIPRYIGCRTHAYTPESMSVGWLSFLAKTTLCDCAIRYKLMVKNKIAERMNMGEEITPTKTVECLERKKLKKSIPHTMKNKSIIIS